MKEKIDNYWEQLVSIRKRIAHHENGEGKALSLAEYTQLKDMEESFVRLIRIAREEYREKSGETQKPHVLDY